MSRGSVSRVLIEFRPKPADLWVVLLNLVAVSSSYPTYAEFCVLLPFVVAFYNEPSSELLVCFGVLLVFSLLESNHFFVLTNALVLAIASSFLTLQQWLQAGSGNANFFFGSCALYSVSLIFLLRLILGLAVQDMVRPRRVQEALGPYQSVRRVPICLRNSHEKVE